MEKLDILFEKATKAFNQLASFNQEEVDYFCRVINQAVSLNAQELAEMAVEETGMGDVQSKFIKNTTMGSGVWITMKNQKSMGIIDEDLDKGLVYLAHPKGIIASVSPVTNPTITPLGNALLAIKGKNVIIISPHPKALKTSTRTVELMRQALKEAGAPEDIIQIVDQPSIEATQALMARSHAIVATGGMAMVKAAYSSGVPAYGVGQGNVQTIIDSDYKDLKSAAESIIMGRTFDRGIICACNQSIILHNNQKDAMVEALENAGALYFEDQDQVQVFRKTLFKNGVINPQVIGKKPSHIGELAGIKVREDVSCLVLYTNNKGDLDPLCGEKLCPVLILTTYENKEEAIEIARANLLYQGAGHTAVIHSEDDQWIRSSASKLPVGRVLVNVPGIAAGGGGLFTHLNPTPSLGCGSWGGNSISENLTYKHLLNISTIAYPRKDSPPSDEEIWAD